MAITLCGTEVNRQGMELAQHGTGLFPDASYFAKTFRELKGCTPSDYRKRDPGPVPPSAACVK